MVSLVSMNIATSLIGQANANAAQLNNQQNGTSLPDPVLAATSEPSKKGDEPFAKNLSRSLADQQTEAALTQIKLEAQAKESSEKGDAWGFAAATVARIEYSKVAKEIASEVASKNQAEAARGVAAIELGIKQDISEMIAETADTNADKTDRGKADASDAMDKAAEKAEEAVEAMTDVRV